MATTTETTPDVRAMHSLVRLCHHRWVIPVVVHLARERGARFALLLHKLDVGRTTLERALAASAELDLVMRNPGHGHPLRPEYLLTPRGESVAPACEGVIVASDGLGLPELTRRKWTLPVLASLEGGAERFAELERDLPRCSPRALAQALDRLQGAGVIHRDLIDERPPRPTYCVSPAANALAQAARTLASAAR